MKSLYWHDRKRQRDAENQKANEWLICPTHGGYCPNLRTARGWARQDCPWCRNDRHQALRGHP